MTDRGIAIKLLRVAGCSMKGWDMENEPTLVAVANAVHELITPSIPHALSACRADITRTAVVVSALSAALEEAGGVDCPPGTWEEGRKQMESMLALLDRERALSAPAAPAPGKPTP